MSKEESSEAVNQETAASDVPSKDPNADIYENRGSKKILRVVTVMAYLFSVSFVGILLSAYYIFLWEPPNPKLIERLQMDPQMQLLIADDEPIADVKKEDFLVENELNRTYEPLLYGSLDAHVNDVDPRDKIALEKQAKLSVMLLKLRHSLVEAQKRRIASQKAAAISVRSDNSSVNARNSILSITEYNESRRNISEGKTRSDIIDISSELVNFASTLEIDDAPLTSEMTILPEIVTKRNHSDGEAVIDSMWNVDRGKETWNYERKLDAKRYPVRGSSNAKRIDNITSDSTSQDDLLSKVIRESPKIDISNDTKSLKDETNDHQLLNNVRENNTSDTIAMSKEYTEDHVNLSSSTDADLNNHRKNYYGNNRFARIARDKVSIRNTSFRNSEVTDGDTGFHQPSDDPNVVKSRPYSTRNSEGERIRADLPALLATLG